MFSDIGLLAQMRAFFDGELFGNKLFVAIKTPGIFTRRKAITT